YFVGDHLAQIAQLLVDAISKRFFSSSSKLVVDVLGSIYELGATMKASKAEEDSALGALFRTYGLVRFSFDGVDCQFELASYHFVLSLAHYLIACHALVMRIAAYVFELSLYVLSNFLKGVIFSLIAEPRRRDNEGICIF